MQSLPFIPNTPSSKPAFAMQLQNLAQETDWQGYLIVDEAGLGETNYLMSRLEKFRGMLRLEDRTNSILIGRATSNFLLDHSEDIQDKNEKIVQLVINLAKKAGLSPSPNESDTNTEVLNHIAQTAVAKADEQTKEKLASRFILMHQPSDSFLLAVIQKLNIQPAVFLKQDNHEENHINEDDNERKEADKQEDDPIKPTAIQAETQICREKQAAGDICLPIGAPADPSTLVIPNPPPEGTSNSPSSSASITNDEEVLIITNEDESNPPLPKAPAEKRIKAKKLILKKPGDWSESFTLSNIAQTVAKVVLVGGVFIGLYCLHSQFTGAGNLEKHPDPVENSKLKGEVHNFKPTESPSTPFATTYHEVFRRHNYDWNQVRRDIKASFKGVIKDARSGNAESWATLSDTYEKTPTQFRGDIFPNMKEVWKEFEANKANFEANKANYASQIKKLTLESYVEAMKITPSEFIDKVKAGNKNYKNDLIFFHKQTPIKGIEKILEEYEKSSNAELLEKANRLIENTKKAGYYAFIDLLDMLEEEKIDIPNFEKIKETFISSFKYETLNSIDPWLAEREPEFAEQSMLTRVTHKAKEGNFWAINTLRRLHHEVFPIENMDKIERAYKANHR